MRPPLWLRRAIRPLIPDALMAALRLREHSRHARVNVDVVIDEPGRTRRWLATTPDTYRIRPTSSFGQPSPGSDVHVLSDLEPVVHERMMRVLADPGIGAVVFGAVDEPRLIDRRRAEPSVAPRGAIVRSDLWAEIGGTDAMDLDVVWNLLRHSGSHIGLIPDADRSPKRRQPIQLPTVIVLSAVPMHDVGGGSRGAQMAQELLHRGVRVVFVSLYPSAESIDLGLRFLHPGLEQYSLAELSIEVLAGVVAGDKPLVLLEVPAPAYVEVVDALSAAGATVVFDLIDDWSDPALGGDWFDADVERRLVSAADLTIASAPDLALRLERLGAAPILIPNGVNQRIFGRDVSARPDDLPEADTPIIGYHGSLYGNWFDWEALSDVAERFDTSPIVIIGDDKAPRPTMPPNVVFLGLKPQSELPAYLTRFSVGLVPFVVSEPMHAVSPLKAFEYLASGVAVAAPPLRALEGIDGVYRAASLTEAVRMAMNAPRPDRNEALMQHSWQARLRILFSAAGLPWPEDVPPPVRIVSRPAVHYERAERRLR